MASLLSRKQVAIVAILEEYRRQFAKGERVERTRNMQQHSAGKERGPQPGHVGDEAQAETFCSKRPENIVLDGEAQNQIGPKPPEMSAEPHDQSAVAQGIEPLLVHCQIDELAPGFAQLCDRIVFRCQNGDLMAVRQ